MTTVNKQKLYVYLDRPQYLSCVTDEYYGQVEIKWRGKLHNSENWEVITPVESFPRNEPDALNNFNIIQASIIQLVTTNQKRNALMWTEIECSALPSYFREENKKIISNKVNLEMYSRYCLFFKVRNNGRIKSHYFFRVYSTLVNYSD